MKLLVQLAVLVGLFLVTTPAEASDFSDWLRDLLNWIHSLFDDTYAGGGSSTPELDVGIAPLAGFVLAALIAAGYERRRRQKSTNR